MSATSSEVHNRPMGMLSIARFCASSSVIPFSLDMVRTRPHHRSVSTGPGFKALTKIPKGANSSAMAMVKLIPAALAAPGVISKYKGLIPSFPITLMIRPQPRSFIYGTATLQVRT